jgi:hypothetical protein
MLINDMKPTQRYIKDRETTFYKNRSFKKRYHSQSREVPRLQR